MRAPWLQAKHTVFFLDYTGPQGFVEATAKVAAQVVVLDHHKTAQEHLSGRVDLPANVALHIDMDRCGASLARDFFQSSQARQPVMHCLFAWASMTCQASASDAVGARLMRTLLEYVHRSAQAAEPTLHVARVHNHARHINACTMHHAHQCRSKLQDFVELLLACVILGVMAT